MKNYTLKQSFNILVLFLFTFIANYHFQHGKIRIENVVIKQLIFAIAISILLFVCNQFIYNYAKKGEGFMEHKVWNKMFIVIFIWLVISFFLFIFLFFATTLQNLIASHKWILFIAAYYFLFLINLFVLSLVHTVDASMKIEKKLFITWASSSLFAALILFFFPSF